jgi:hypothetical protein
LVAATLLGYRANDLGELKSEVDMCELLGTMITGILLKSS